MDRGGLRALLFWLMFFAGSGALAACMILPAWLDYSDARARVERSRDQIADLIYRLKANQQRIEHLLHDPDYQQRVAQEVLGIERPGVETVRIQPAPPASAPRPAATSQPAGGLFPAVDPVNIARGISSTARQNPFVAIFVLEQTRPLVMAIAGLTVAAAVVLLHLPQRSAARQRPSAEQRREAV